MRIVHIIEAIKAGGKERQMLELVHGTLAAGHDAQVIVQSPAMEYDTSGIADRIHVLPRRSRWDAGLVARTRALVQALKPDVVHSWGTMCSLYAVPATGFGRTPLVAGHLRDAPSRLPWHDKRFWHGRLSHPFAAAIVANSKAGLAAYRVEGPRAHVIYNGFDFAGRVAAPDPGLLPALGIATPHVVAMVARFGGHKDYATFFTAAERVLAQRRDVTFVAIGDGPGLDEWRRRFATNANVRLLGRRGDVERIVANITLGVLLTEVSGHGEGISNALTEILAAGKPVIATNDGGNRELVAGNDCGILVPPASAQAVEAAVCALLDDPARAAAMGAAGRRMVIDEFSREAMVENWLGLYRRIAGNGRT